MKQILESTFRQALVGSHPSGLTERNLPEEAPALVVAVGKAALPMVGAALARYPGTPWLATPPASVGGRTEVGRMATDETREGLRVRAEENALLGAELPGANAAVPAGGLVLPGSHPLPDERSVVAAEKALELVGALGADDLVLLLVSGGGSALWCAPEGVDLAGKRDLTLHLQRAGATIGELNTVRRHLSRIKGGWLLRATEARVMSLVLSDVPGDVVHDVASGPGVSDPTTFADARDVLRRYPGPANRTAMERFERGMRGEIEDTVKPGSEADARSAATVIGSSSTLLSEAAAYLANSVGVQAIELHHDLGGEARELADHHARMVATLLAGGDARPLLPMLAADPPYVAWRLARLDPGRPVALLTGGEATVTVKGDGRGGRNQEFALAFALCLNQMAPGANVWALSAGSDGVDGASEAAGAFVTPDTLARAADLGLDPQAMLDANDSGTFFERLGDQLVTGPTGHNLNDVRLLLLPPPDTTLG